MTPANHNRRVFILSDGSTLSLDDRLSVLDVTVISGPRALFVTADSPAARVAAQKLPHEDPSSSPDLMGLPQ